MIIMIMTTPMIIMIMTTLMIIMIMTTMMILKTMMIIRIMITMMITILKKKCTEEKLHSKPPALMIIKDSLMNPIVCPFLLTFKTNSLLSKLDSNFEKQ